MGTCSVCLNYSRRHKISYFSYPCDPIRRNKWLKAVGREDLVPIFGNKRTTYAKICEEHFEQKYHRYSGNCTVKRLANDAFPTLRLEPKHVTGATGHSLDSATESLTQTPDNSHSQNIPETEGLPQCLPNILVLTGCYIKPSSEVVVLNNDMPCNIDINSTEKADVVSDCKKENEALKETLGDSTNIAQKNKLSSHSTVKKAKTYSSTTQTRMIKNASIDAIMPKGMSQLIKWHRQLKGNKGENRYSKSFLCFALHLHYLGPTTYRFLENTFCLPPMNVLKTFIKPRGTKINDTLFSVLKIKLDKMGPQENICSVCVSCVPIKTNLFYDISHDRITGFNDINGKQTYEPAQYAVIVMVRGIVINWKQLIGYAFLSQFKNVAEVNTWINEIISCLLKIGFKVLALVLDHSDFLNISKSVNIENTCFFIGDHKIYYLFDVPRLINSAKNQLIKCNYIFEDKIGKWCHIKDMYDQDKNNLVRLAPNLTENHLNPSKHVELSAQVLSTTVAFAIKTLMQSNLIDSTARDTVELLLKLDKLFDILNSSKARCPNKFKTAFCGDDFQIDFLQEMLGFFRRLKLVEVGKSNRDVTSSVDFIKFFQITIKSFLHLFNDLQLVGIKLIYTRRFNLELVDNFFDRINQTYGISSKPTCAQVAQTFNKIFVIDILKEPVKKVCGNDYESLLANQEDSLSLIESFSPNTEDVTPILLDSNDYQFELPKQSGLLFLSVYLYKKCLEKHTCATMDLYVKMCDQELAECSQNYPAESHTALPDSFVSFIELLDQHFCGHFNTMSSSTIIIDEHLVDMRSANIGNEVLLQIQDYTFDAPCGCFPIEYLKKLFVRSRIYQSVKKYNAFIKSGKYGKMPFDISIL